MEAKSKGEQVVARPAVFFSHSVQDANILSILKDKFTQKTGESIDVFLSSDGSSMPFGRNWQRSIEDALARAQLMFTFLSPMSVTSKWIYFESGFAYSKGIRVVPVGLEGVDLAEQPPPLQLLQGFNIRGYEGLNNLIAIANDVFKHRHALSFVEADYADLLFKTKLGPRRAFGRWADHVEAVIVKIESDLPEEEWVARYSATLGAEELVDHFDGRTATLGLRIYRGKTEVNFAIDRLAVDSVFPVVSLLLKSNQLGSANAICQVWLGKSVYEEQLDLRRSAALIGTGWTPRSNAFVNQLSGSAFELCYYEAEHQYDEDAAYVEIIDPSGPTIATIKDVLDLCFDRGLLLEAKLGG